MSRRTVSSCVLCAFALAPAAFAADVPGDAATGGAAAPAPQAPALAPTPAEAVQQAPAPQQAPPPVAIERTAPPPAPPAPPQPVSEPQPQPVVPTAVMAMPTAAEIAAAPDLEPTSAVAAQSDDDVVDVPVPRRRRAAPAPAPAPVPAPVAQAAPKLPTTGFDLGVFTAAALVLLGTGVGLSAAVGPAPRRR